MLRTTPLKKYLSQIDRVRAAPTHLKDFFRVQVIRRVGKDRSIIIEGNLFEAPVELIGKRVTCLLHFHDPKRVEVVFTGHSYGFLVPQNAHINARVKRQPRMGVEIESGTPDKLESGTLFDNKKRGETK